MQTVSAREMISAAEAATRLGLSRNRIYALCACGVLSSVRLDGKIQVDGDSVQRMWEMRRQSRRKSKPKHLRLIVNNDK
ncbi:helix-turn-helix domain-containing protein [Brucella anthropi]|uniref:helix-turn-helix domain-containing protein n=1 Tax=Brucella anthropi TaxID=529 RepID=UPI0005BDA46D|nr:helix-turn-helix domain-containing protein [Brucella anthropi]